MLVRNLRTKVESIVRDSLGESLIKRGVCEEVKAKPVKVEVKKEINKEKKTYKTKDLKAEA